MLWHRNPAKSPQAHNAPSNVTVSLWRSSPIVALLCLPAFGLVPNAYVQVAAGKTSPCGLKLVVSTEKPVAQISQPLTVHVTLTNQSAASFTLTDRLWTERDYELHLFDMNGKEAPLTKDAKKMRFWPIRGSTMNFELAPGAKIEFDQNLANIYAVSDPGTYTLEACRDIPGVGNLYSNKLALPFVPAAK